MIIGVDFDNTIVCYEEIFHRAGCEMSLIPEDLPANKTAIRGYLQERGRNDLWTELQGVVYGERMSEAKAFDGVIDFFQLCREKKIPVCIISHKTQFPFIGEQHDLHESALEWLEDNGFFDKNKIGLKQTDVIFNPTRIGKIKTIISQKCTHFIDDLPEVFDEEEFPEDVEKILFDPTVSHAEWSDGKRVTSWIELKKMFFK